jgi:hypothetical protein
MCNKLKSIDNNSKLFLFKALKSKNKSEFYLKYPQAHGAWISFPPPPFSLLPPLMKMELHTFSLILYQSKNCGHRIHVLFMMYDVYWYCQMKKKRKIMKILKKEWSVRRSFPRNLAENSEAASFLGQTTSYKTIFHWNFDFSSNHSIIYFSVWISFWTVIYHQIISMFPFRFFFIWQYQ